MSPDLAQQYTADGDLADRQQPAPGCSIIAWRTLTLADRACCCPARPVVVAVMPPSAGRAHPTDLLLCAHHYRASQAALNAAGATVFDSADRRIMPPARALLDRR